MLTKVLKHEAKQGEARFASVEEVLRTFASIQKTDPAALSALITSLKAEAELIVQLPEAEVHYFFFGHGLGCFGIAGRLDSQTCLAFSVDPTVALEVRSQAFRRN